MHQNGFFDSWHEPEKNDPASSSSSRVEVCGRYHSSDEEGENGSGNKNETMVAESCATRSRFWYGVWSTWTKGERNWYQMVFVVIFRRRFPKIQRDAEDKEAF